MSALSLRSLFKGPAFTARQKGDAARDCGDWISAERSYQKYLRLRPQDGPIWIQLGHARKEQGKLCDAEDAYRQALLLPEQDAEAWLHIGHVCKLTNRIDEATAAYQRSFKILPSDDARQELRALLRYAGDGGARSALEFDAVEGSLRTLGDRARDARDWAVAENRYREHLTDHPEDVAIIVQLGHTLKEQGRVEEAGNAYARAVALTPNNPDPHLHLGHTWKLRGRVEDAFVSYQRSFAIEPTMRSYDEIRGLQQLSDPRLLLEDTTYPENKSEMLIEIDDLLDYLRNYKTLSGIQRVQSGIIDVLLRGSVEQVNRYAFIRTGRHVEGLWRLRVDDLRHIIDYTAGSCVEQVRLTAMISEAEKHATIVRPLPEQVYFILGAFWGFGSNAAKYQRLKNSGVRIGIYVYDLIPMTHPEFCTAALAREFILAFGDVLRNLDFILTISAFVAQDIRRLLGVANVQPLPVEPVLLAHEMNAGILQRSGIDRAWSEKIVGLKHRSFVLMVSTIEARKNHSYLIAVWRLLLAEGVTVPDLVFVGRFGWKMGDFRQSLIDSDFLGGLVHVLHDVSDVDLAILYDNCLFTAFPSIVEGWGLPVGESLVHGRPCVAANSSSIPEVGGSLVDYIDPWNVRDGVETFRRMITDVGYRQQRERDIKIGFTARRWENVCAEILTQVAAAKTHPAIRPEYPLLAEGEVLEPGLFARMDRAPRNYVNRPLRGIFAESCYSAEPFGAWMRGVEGHLRFVSDLSPDTSIIVFLGVFGAPWLSGHEISVTLERPPGRAKGKVTRRVRSERGERPLDPSKQSSEFPLSVMSEFENEPFVPTEASVTLQAADRKVLMVRGVVPANQMITLHVLITGEHVGHHAEKEKGDDRVYYAGFEQMAYHRAGHQLLHARMRRLFTC